MTEQRHDTTLASLDQRIQQAKSRSREAEAKANTPRGQHTGMGVGFRVAVEMVAALGVGVGIGIGLDIWLETSPLMLIVFFLLGAGAAFMNVYRIAKSVDAQRLAAREAAAAPTHGKSAKNNSADT